MTENKQDFRNFFLQVSTITARYLEGSVAKVSIKIELSMLGEIEPINS